MPLAAHLCHRSARLGFLQGFQDRAYLELRLLHGACLESVEVFFMLATKPSMPASTPKPVDYSRTRWSGRCTSRSPSMVQGPPRCARRSVHPAPSCRDRGPHAWFPDIGTDLIKEAYSPSAVGALSERETCLVISEREMVAEPGAQSRGLCGR